jgi:hypothetical protein
VVEVGVGMGRMWGVWFKFFWLGGLWLLGGSLAVFRRKVFSRRCS